MLYLQERNILFQLLKINNLYITSALVNNNAIELQLIIIYSNNVSEPKTEPNKKMNKINPEWNKYLL